MKIEVINIEGKKVNTVEISDKIFSSEVNKKLIKSIVDWQLNHSKPRVAKTKQRNEIIGSTAKIYAQKGTGGARHSSRKAPIFVGGGVAHGPKGAVYKIKKTKIFNQFLVKNNLKDSLIISDKNSKTNIVKSARNIPNLKIIDEEGTNVYDLLKYKNIVFTTTSIKKFQDRLIK